MPTGQVIVVALTAALKDRAEALVRDLDHLDLGDRRPAVRLHSGGSLDVSGVGVSVVLALAAPDTSGPVVGLLDELHDARVPSLVLVPGERIPLGGALTESLDAPLEVLAAAVRALFHRQHEVHRLRRESEHAARCNGGLHGEIARMHDEMQLAAMVQREFLPRQTPTVHNVHFGALWRPSSYVSGDIYDITVLDEDHVGIFLADAVGHGVPAALLTMVICRSLPTREPLGRSYRIVPPSEALARLNGEMIRRQAGTPRFATAVYGVLNCRTRTLTLAGAGHPPPLLLGADGSVRELEAEGGLLGIFPQERFEQVEIALEVDDTLLVYSDGFEQAFPETGIDGRPSPSQRYLDEFRALRGAGPAPAVIERLHARLDGESGSLHQADDVTLLCATAGGLAESTTGVDRSDAQVA